MVTDVALDSCFHPLSQVISIQMTYIDNDDVLIDTDGDGRKAWGWCDHFCNQDVIIGETVRRR